VKVRVVYKGTAKDGKSVRVGFRPVEGGEVQFISLQDFPYEKGDVLEWNGQSFSKPKGNGSPKSSSNGDRRINASVALKAACELYGHLLVANAVETENAPQVVINFAKEFLQWLESIE